MSTSLFIFRNIMSYPESHYDNIGMNPKTPRAILTDGTGSCMKTN